MYGLPVSYPGKAGVRQPQRRRGIAVLILLAAATAGCSRVMPFDRGPETTGSVRINASATDAVDPSDWGTVKRTLAGTAALEPGLELAWQNPETGSTGMVAIESVDGTCRAFATTVNDMRGVRRYRGEACGDGNGLKLGGIVPDDRMLL